MALIPIRVIIAMLGMYACALVYTQRSAMSVAIVAMTTAKHPHHNSNHSGGNHSHECIAPDTYDQMGPRNGAKSAPEYFDSSYSLATTQQYSNKSHDDDKPEFDWSAKLQGIILGSQFWLYIFMPTVMGRVTDIFGAKWVNFVGALGPCVLSILSPVGVRKGGVYVLIAIRVLDGAFHSCVYGSLFSLYTKWFPVRERANANASLFFGGSLGATIMYSLAGWACDSSIGWPMVYYVNALLYIPWFVLWIIFCTNDPSQNRHISDEELAYIKANVQHSATKKKRAVPWRAIISSVPVLSSLFIKMCSGFGYFLLITKMPSYLATIFGIPIFSNGNFSASTTLAQGVCALLAAPLSNWIIAKGNYRALHVRKVFQTVAMIGPAVCLALIPAMGCNSTGVIVLLLLSMFTYGFFTGGEWTTLSEYAPNSAGAVFGFTNSLAFAMGVIAPYVVGILLDEKHSDSRSAWNLIFYVTAVIYVLGLVSFLLFGSDEQQEWDKIADDDQAEACDAEQKDERASIAESVKYPKY